MEYALPTIVVVMVAIFILYKQRKHNVCELYDDLLTQFIYGYNGQAYITADECDDVFTYANRLGLQQRSKCLNGCDSWVIVDVYLNCIIKFEIDGTDRIFTIADGSGRVRYITVEKVRYKGEDNV